MENTNVITVSADYENRSAQTPAQVEDAALKITTQYFSDVLVPYFHIEGEVDHIAPTETVYLDLKKLYQDFNLVMKDGSWVHFEFQSTDSNALEDLKRFRTYEAHISHQHKVDVRTYVLFSGNITNPRTEFTSGFNTYRVHPIIMKGHRAEEVFEHIDYKIKNSIPLTREDLVPLTLCPLMGGDMPQKQRIHKAFQIIHQSSDTIPDVDKIEAVIYAMASKFLKGKEFEQLKEEVKMTELGLFIYNDGVKDGIEKEALDNAKNFFLNGAPYEMVRKSIHTLSDEVLQKIYDEVMTAQNV